MIGSRPSADCPPLLRDAFKIEKSCQNGTGFNVRDASLNETYRRTDLKLGNDLNKKIEVLAKFLIRYPKRICELLTIAIASNQSTADRYLFWTKLIGYTFAAKNLPKVSDNVQLIFSSSPIVGHLDYTHLSSWILIASLGFLDSWRSANEPHVTPISPIYMDVKTVFFDILNAQVNNSRENVATSNVKLRAEDFSLLKQITQKPLFWLLYSLFSEALNITNNSSSSMWNCNLTIGHLNLIRIGCT